MEPARKIASIVIVGLAILGLLLLYSIYDQFRIDVPAKHIAVLIKKTGKDIENSDTVAPDDQHKGVQLEVLTEGRYFYNPYFYDWNVYPMVEIPDGKMGIRIRLYGKNLPYSHFVATGEDQKGIVEDVLRPGRYPLNATVSFGGKLSRERQDFVEIVELHDPISIPAGYKGVVTNLAGPIPDNPNTVLVEKGFRGVQKETLDAGTYYLNPYQYRINSIDCRSQRFNLAENKDMGFPSKDGFWVSLDGVIEFRIKPEEAAKVFTIYNDYPGDKVTESVIHEAVIKKVIRPNARSFCRLRGSNAKGRDFIGGETRTAFQKDFQAAMHTACDSLGVEVLQALITRIDPPQAIAKPVRDREVARQKLGQYKEQRLQQEAEAKLAIEKALIEQKQAIVQADQVVIQKVTKANQEQEVAVTKGNEDLEVSKRDLAAAKDKAAAVFSRKKAEAGVIVFENEAEAAGWKMSVEALGGDGNAYARFVLLQKLSPAYKNIMINTQDSPLMDIFRDFDKGRPLISPKQ